MTVTFSAPILETDRLFMRAPELGDLDALVAFYASERSEFVGGPQSADVTWRTLAQEAGHWVLRGFGRWVLVEKATGNAVGVVGFSQPNGLPERELGWDLFETATGKGYATEAALAARNHAYADLGWTTVISLIATKNEASRKVARRLGAKLAAKFAHERFGPSEIWQHPGPEGAC